MPDLPPVSPRHALYAATDAGRPLLPVCDHYAGAEARMRKSLALQADMAQEAGRVLFDVTLDLEDGAELGNETEQLALVCELLNGPTNLHDRVGVRVHAPSDEAFEHDVDTLIAKAGARLAYIMVPKLQDLGEARRALATVEASRLRHGVARKVPLHGLIETHCAVQQVHEIARLPGVESLSFGLMDFVSDHRGAIPASAMTATGQFSHPLVVRAKLEIAAACHAAGIVPSHCVVTEFKDLRALGKAADRAASELGYTRMWSIHPEQIPVIIESFAPVTAEVDEAIDILLAAQAASWGPIAHHGVLHDRASYRLYWHVLERAWLTGQPLPGELEAAWFG